MKKPIQDRTRCAGLANHVRTGVLVQRIVYAQAFTGKGTGSGVFSVGGRHALNEGAQCGRRLPEI